ncbi:MAG TPA: acyltransferase [Ktedonobacterales bacterium]
MAHRSLEKVSVPTTKVALRRLPGTETPIRRLKREFGHALAAIRPRLHLANFLARLLPVTSLNTMRARVFHWLGITMGARVSFLGPITIVGGGDNIYRRLTLGSDVLIGLNPLFNLDDTITIGDNVALGPSVSIYTSTHLLGPASRRMNRGIITRPVVIEDGAWIGVGAIILPGVTIGRGSVISAGTVVSESVSPNTLVSGNPAKAVMDLPWPDD